MRKTNATDALGSPNPRRRGATGYGGPVGRWAGGGIERSLAARFEVGVGVWCLLR
jgi:hypothetical protein